MVVKWKTERSAELTRQRQNVGRRAHPVARSAPSGSGESVEKCTAARRKIQSRVRATERAYLKRDPEPSAPRFSTGPLGAADAQYRRDRGDPSARPQHRVRRRALRCGTVDTRRSPIFSSDCTPRRNARHPKGAGSDECDRCCHAASRIAARSRRAAYLIQRVGRHEGARPHRETKRALLRHYRRGR
jgi:hypothetical protein